jgi:hypothetical protein
MDDSGRDYLKEHAADVLGLSKKLSVQQGIIALRYLSYPQDEKPPQTNMRDDKPQHGNTHKSEKIDDADGDGMVLMIKVLITMKSSTNVKLPSRQSSILLSFGSIMRKKHP